MAKNQRHTFMLTAMLMLGAAAASAQDTMTASIPFAFQLPGIRLRAGNYIVTQVGSSIIQFRNTDAPSIGALVVVRNTGDSRDGTPRLVFNCYDGNCSLPKLFGAGRGWECNPPHVRDAQRERLATVYLHRSKGQ